jgi:uncharacterized iron-regulated membrane protein
MQWLDRRKTPDQQLNKKSNNTLFMEILILVFLAPLLGLPLAILCYIIAYWVRRAPAPAPPHG